MDYEENLNTLYPTCPYIRTSGLWKLAHKNQTSNTAKPLQWYGKVAVDPHSIMNIAMYTATGYTCL